MHPHQRLFAAMILGCPLAACSAGAAGGTNATQGGPGADGATFGPDAAGGGDDGGVDAPYDGPPPVGTQIKQGDSLSVRAITPDGYLVYSDDSIPELYAMPLAGGTTQDLGALGSKFELDLRGLDMFIWSNVSSTSVGTLSVWSSASGLHTISSASFTILSSASTSGGQILYLDNVNQAGTVGDVYVAGPDGSGKTRLVGQVPIEDSCAPNLAFAGSYAVVSYCPAGLSGNFAATLASFSGSSWAPGASIPGTSGSWWTDTAGTKALYTTAGGVSVTPLAGGATTLIDGSGTNGFLSSDGTSAFYLTSSSAFKRSPTIAPTPMTLVSSGFNQWQGLSDDAQHLLYYSNYTANGTDLFVTSTTTPGQIATISSATTASTPCTPFTADSTHAIYASAGVLHAYSLAGQTTSGPLGSNIFMCTAASAAKIVFSADFESTNELRFGRANLTVTDTAGADAPVELVPDADAVFALSPGGTQIVYAWSAIPGANAGLWTINVP